MALPPQRAASTGPDQPGKAADADDAFADPLRSVRSELGALSGNIDMDHASTHRYLRPEDVRAWNERKLERMRK